MLQDINLLVGSLHSFLVTLISEVALLPPKAVLAKQATTAGTQNPCALVFCESVVELSALDDCTLKGPVCLVTVSNWGLVFVALGRSRVNAAYQ